MQFATGSVIPGYSRGHWRTVGNVSTAVLMHTFEVSVSYKKNLTKLYSRLNTREISLLIFSPPGTQNCDKTWKPHRTNEWQCSCSQYKCCNISWSLEGLSFCSYIKTSSNFRFSKLRILSQWPFFPNNQSTISWSLLDFEHMLLIQKENSTT